MKKKKLLGFIFVLFVCCIGVWIIKADIQSQPQFSKPQETFQIPIYDNQLVVEIQDNQPSFTQEDLERKEGVLVFQELDSLGRTQSAMGMIGIDNLPGPEEKRESIGMVKPSGWVVARYDDLIEDKYLYNRCHLIAWSLSKENANEKNLITGTHALNHEGMLPYEQQVLSYIRNTQEPVLYRVTPIYEGSELVCRGVEMEAYSVLDKGKSISFHIFCFNVQPGVVIDYQTGQSHREQKKSEVQESTQEYVLNTRSKRFHLPTCKNVMSISEKNKDIVESTFQELIQEGYDPAWCCNR